jgi:ubiquinone biosynthesis protein UbiJ
MLHLPKSKLQEFVIAASDVSSITNSDEVKVEGDVSILTLFASLIIQFDLDWNIVTD